VAFQEALRRNCIKFRPNRPRAPHLNGKVERSQQTDWVEFYATVDLKDLIQREVPACKGGGVSKVPRLPADCHA
jgi:transposase InsO family protein